MADHGTMKLGALPAVVPYRMLLSLTGVGENLLLAEPPGAFSALTVGRAGVIDSYSMRQNDRYGCCVPAGLANAEMIMSNCAGRLHDPSDAAVLQSYSLCNPAWTIGVAGTDVGCVVHDALVCYRDHGLPLGPDGSLINIASFASAFTPGRPEATKRLIKWSIVLGGGIGLGLALPVSAQSMSTWDLGGDATPWGGHFVWGTSYNEAGLNCITWGEAKTITWRALTAWCREAWMIYDDDHLDAVGKLPIGLSREQLADDMATVGLIAA